MSPDQLADAIDEVGNLGLEAEGRAKLEKVLLTPLIKAAPQLALERFSARIGRENDAVAILLPEALKAWAMIDPAAACAWMDRQIAAGTFDSKSLDGRSQARLDFEAALAASLLEMEDAAAAARIGLLPEDQRRQALEQIDFASLKPTARDAYADVVRGLIPADERDGSFAHIASQLAQTEGFQGVDAFLNSIAATPAEREVTARQAATAQMCAIAADEPLTHADIDAMRAWLRQQAPEIMDKATGEALCEAAETQSEFDIEAASKLALDYHRRGTSDELMAAFIERLAARSHNEQAMALVGEIRDSERRQKLLSILK